jgi:integrase
VLKLVRRPKSPHWIIRGTVRGYRVEESTKTSNKRFAEEIRTKREVEILEASVHGRSATATFAEAALDYLENGGNRRFLEKVIKHFGTTPLAKIDQAAIETGARKLYPDAAPSTRDRQFFTPVSAVLKHAAKRGLCTAPILERPAPPSKRIRWLNEPEADRLIAATNEHLRSLVIFMLYTGARVGEALWLDWKQVDLTRRQITFVKTKNGDVRSVPLHDRAFFALANLPHREGEVFRRPDDAPYERPKRDDDTSAGSRIKKAFRGACRRAGIEDFRVHDLRHTWATWFYQETRDLNALMALGGWRTVGMVFRYAHANVGHFKNSIDRLPGGNLGDKISQEEKSA